MVRKSNPESGGSRGPIYQIKITLMEVTPPIWRRFAVHGAISLSRLHDVLQIVMGWTDSHLHEFNIDEHSYVADYDLAERDWDETALDEGDFRLDHLIKRKGESFEYKYDFGDGWRHELVVEKIIPPEEGVKYPVCLAGERACPPEDCGGPWGYDELLESLADPDHEEHERSLEWLGGRYDPEEFNLEKINRLLRRKG
ncbi:MAG: plasmid pRiA4b ORF-3 family protein [Candidatus Omnitrophica bacterium]|nr:plasmid pRiA4b ORF-3 family protein [Candidatus Omnitrophota bacterium]